MLFFLVFSFVLFFVLLCARNCATFWKLLCFFCSFQFCAFFVLLCARNCATFRKFLCFFLVFSFVFFCVTLCSELCYFSENSCAFFVPRLQFFSTSTSTKKAQLFFDCLSPKRKFEILVLEFEKLFRKSGACSIPGSASFRRSLTFGAKDWVKLSVQSWNIEFKLCFKTVPPTAIRAVPIQGAF